MIIYRQVIKTQFDIFTDYTSEDLHEMSYFDSGLYVNVKYVLQS